MKNLKFLMVVLAFMFCVNINAQNQQEYKLNRAESEHFIKLSRDEVDKNNLPLARTYAKKAIQADSWYHLAWANYDDIIQKIADEGDIVDFGTAIEESESSGGGAAQPGGKAQFEGC